MGDDCIYCITWCGLDLTWCGLDLLMTSFKVGQGIAFIPKDYPLLGYLITLCGIQIIKENVCKQQYSYNFGNIDNYPQITHLTKKESKHLYETTFI